MSGAISWTAALLLLVASLLRGADAIPDRDKLLKELDGLEASHRQTQLGSLGTVLGEITAAAGNPQAALDLYEKAVFETQFNGVKGDQEAFRDWEKKRGPSFHDALFTQALNFQLRYFALTLQYVRQPDAAPLAAPLVDYVRDLWQFLPVLAPAPPDGVPAPTQHHKHGDDDATKANPDEARNLLGQSLADSALAKYYQVDSLLGNLDGWPLNPGSDSDILKKTVFPALRKDKNPLLLTLWDEWINAQTQASAANPLADQQAKFNNETLPALLWSKAQDLLALDKPDDAVKEMLSLIKAYPLHPDNAAWISQLRPILKGEAPPPPAPGAKSP